MDRPSSPPDWQVGDPCHDQAAWVLILPERRTDWARDAAAAHDADALWALTEAWISIYGKAGSRGSTATLRVYRTGIRQLVAAWSAVDLTAPPYDAGPLWLRALEQAGAKPSTVTTRLAAARTLYKALEWSGACHVDPFRHARPAPDSVPKWEKRRPYAEEDVTRLLAAAGADHRARVLVLLLAHGGLRISEALALAWRDCDVPRRTLLVARGKGGKSRTVALSPSLTAALARLHGPDTDDETRVLSHLADARTARRHIAALCARAHVEYRGAHSFRHYCGTRLVREAHGSLLGARDHLGHTSVAVTETYTHWANDEAAKAVGAW